jgi:hypothetical protein
LVESATILAIGHSPRVTLPEEAGRLIRLRERCHGDSCFSVYEAAVVSRQSSEELAQVADDLDISLTTDDSGEP